MKIPQHIAIIMDGNGRWAKKRGLPRIAGHKEGAESLRAVTIACAELGVKHLTVYAFSTENWQRPAEEVEFLMGLFAQSIDNRIKELVKNNVRLRFLGRLKDFSAELQEKMQYAMNQLAGHTGLNLNVMVSYGGRTEILDAFHEINSEQLLNEQITESTISEHLYTRGLPDPDLLIRTANEMRISNFLLWQIAYAELFVTSTLWPDFRKESLLAAIEEYNKRERKFGKTSEQIK